MAHDESAWGAIRALQRELKELRDEHEALREKYEGHGHTTISRSGGFTSGTPRTVSRLVR